MNKQDVLNLILETKSIILDDAAAEDVTVKGAADYVTRVDVTVQRFMQERLYALDPAIGFIAEEKENRDLDPAGRYWILDPIDGTTNLICHYNMSAVSLGLYDAGEIVFGAVYNPFTGEFYQAEKGKGAYLNGKPIRVSDRPMKDAVISYGSSPYEKERAKEIFPLFQRIFEHCADFRRCGSAALDLCYVASGRTSAFLEENLKPWDYAAGSIILTEAGGTITDWKNQRLPYLTNADILAVSPAIEGELREILSTFR